MRYLLIFLSFLLMAGSADARKMSNVEWVGPQSEQTWKALSLADKQQSILDRVASKTSTALTVDTQHPLANVADDPEIQMLGELTKTIGLGQEILPYKNGQQKAAAKPTSEKQVRHDEALAKAIVTCIDGEMAKPEYQGLAIGMANYMAICSAKERAIMNAEKVKSNP